MHLLVLSAFRRDETPDDDDEIQRLNAPFGAQCFPTRVGPVKVARRRVSMHLLVLSAFRRGCARPR